MKHHAPFAAMSRRQALAWFGAAAASGAFCSSSRALAQEGAGAEEAADAIARNPVAGVEDTASGIRITGLRATPVGATLFVKIETNHKVSGWGETSGLPSVKAALADQLASLLIGENPTRIEHLWQKMYRAHRGLRDGPFMVNTISAIDMALWDIAGKLWGVPVYRLLGGPCRERIRGYHSEKSWKAPPGGICEHSADPCDIERMVKMVRDARERVGPDGTVMFDAHCDMPPAVVIQFAAAIKPYDVLFIEEPAVHGNIEVFKRIRESVNVPLATGENVRTIFGFIPYLQERCIDVLQPDCGHCGGISQMRKIATLAEAYYVPLAPHCTMSFLGMTASLHCAASTPLFLIHETYPHIGEGFGALARKRWEMDPKTGYVTLPEGPGLGVEMDEKVLAELSAKPPSEFKWLNARYKDGSIADQ